MLSAFIISRVNHLVFDCWRHIQASFERVIKEPHLVIRR
ncbi:BnaCnng22790D [Brassica napus]|uniref:BnaCnng22790D protein n=1 Tax=Brassica napus TaxID=3708 RepID=A0A078INH2_BRANA|nr:BnaCnng22790D [Brassica napus]